MFNVKVLDTAIKSLSDEGRAEIQKMINVLEGYKTEVESITEVLEGYEQLVKNLQKENDELKAKLAESNE